MKDSVNPFSVHSSRVVYSNPWLELREDQVTRPGGTQGIFGVVRMKSGASVLAVNDENEVYLVSEYKYAIARESLEVVSGATDGTESPLETARRELSEELGFEAEEWTDFGFVNPFTTIIESPNYLFMARKLHTVDKAPDEGEILRTVRMPIEQALSMVMASEINHAASSVLILKAARCLGMTF